MERSDAIINQDHPVVQEAQTEDHLELVLPETGVAVEMHAEVFMSLFADGMRIITGETMDDYR